MAPDDVLAQRAVIYRGTFRVYFNRKVEAPRLWCVSPPDHAWELCFQAMHVMGVVLTSHTNLEAIAEVQPAAWLEGEGELQLDGDLLVIEPFEPV